MVLATLIYIITIIVAIIVIIALLKFLFQLFYIAPVGIEALDVEIYSRAIFTLQPSNKVVNLYLLILLMHRPC